MGRGRRGLVPAAASGPKERHKRSQRSQYHHPYSPPPDTFKAKPSLPKSKHHSYFELVENKEKKKKLEYQITTEKTPPPGFEFVPIGNPQLTAACKEISREKDAMIFIVSNAKGLDETILANQVHRVGHHIRQVIVEEAKESLGGSSHHVVPVTDAGPEPIPESQRAYHAQVDAAIRDLFPRIPNTDRQMIIEHSFTRGSANRSEHPVGFSEDIALSRRVQLAVLAHIRHTHTRYDMLLKETTWQKARKTVESLCLDILVKWRGDEETGRDQLDEILREVVVISDSEDDEDDDEEESTDYTSDEGADNARLTPMPVYRSAPPLQPVDRTDRSPPQSPIREAIPVPSSHPIRIGLEDIDRGRRVDRRAQRGFRRYRAWEEAIRRNRGETPLAEQTSPDMAISHASYRPSPPVRFSYDAYGRPYDNPDPTVHSGGVFGISSHLDGHRMQQPVYGMPSSLNSSPYPGRTVEAQSSHEKVMSVVPFPTSTSSRELASSSASSHFQDMLVRSIESRSPTAQPTFIRTLPPRSQASVSSYAPLATSLTSIQQPPKFVSHPGEEVRSWDRPPPAHVITGFNRSQAMSIDAMSSRDSVQSHDLCGSTYLHPPTGYGAQPAPPFAHQALSNPGPSSSRFPETRRIVLQATRPGERSNPILMEDRGGYFERVNPRPESSSRIQLRPVRPSQPQTEVENRGIIRPHTIFSWEEDLRNRGGRRGVAEIEVNPIIDPRPHAPHIRQYAPHEYFGAPPPAKEEDYRVQSRRVPGGDYGAAPPEGYWTIRQHGDEQVSRPHHEPAVYHPINTLPPRADERFETRQGRRPLAQPAPNVIIID
ncbi:uncharacterized protein TrAFT101_004910 [Trichoderma asperellum]|uniref:DUF2293 domain-containing protein n=2 Tax=Trichoderma asperellum TaxID=101201 RepID=A0A2T3Z5H9_TRIA4|nr:hypothetical protein M441DRAFT_141892 [Trichoderma asperellum CBS 433.97]PTB40045.1 hypothetical protein M441DRAFT_141892 [Trichoderma asperellum CBS 433.97]UKZ89873.1 hypothetical protein TrAFT101_004910 [Trichoderma asperellum]